VLALFFCFLYFFVFAKFLLKHLQLSLFLSIFALGVGRFRSDRRSVMFMNTEQMTQMIAEYFKTQPVLKAWIFGSYARGEETESSDVDILVILDYSQPIGLKFFGMYEDLKELLGRPVDLVSDRTLAPFARASVERDKKLVYERVA
jgi:predicted nucleotidyltransferase